MLLFHLWVSIFILIEKANQQFMLIGASSSLAISLKISFNGQMILQAKESAINILEYNGMAFEIKHSADFSPDTIKTIDLHPSGLYFLIAFHQNAVVSYSWNNPMFNSVSEFYPATTPVAIQIGYDPSRKIVSSSSGKVYDII